VNLRVIILQFTINSAKKKTNKNSGLLQNNRGDRNV